MKNLLLYIDLLGFSNKVQSFALSELISFYKKLIMEIKVSLERNNNKLKFYLISDSLFIYVDDKNLAKNFEILVDCASVLFHNLLLGDEILCRGAIVYDEFYIGYHDFFKIKNRKLNLRKNFIFTLLGKAIMKAIYWEKIQEWCGISILPDDLNILKEIIPNTLIELQKSKYLLDWEIPIKKDNILTKQRSYIINPLFSLYDKRCNYIIFKKYKLYKNNLDYLVKLKNTRKLLLFLYKNKIIINQNKREGIISKCMNRK